MVTDSEKDTACACLGGRASTAMVGDDSHISLRAVFASDAGECVVAGSRPGRHAIEVIDDCSKDNTRFGSIG